MVSIERFFGKTQLDNRAFALGYLRGSAFVGAVGFLVAAILALLHKVSPWLLGFLALYTFLGTFLYLDLLRREP